MHARKISSILIIAILAAVTTFSSSTFLTPALAQTGAEEGGETTQESTDTGADTGATSEDYQEFETCLTEAEGEEGFATEDEIRECFQPIYIVGDASEDEDSEGGSQDEDSEGGSQDEDDNNSESNGSGN
jgi:hypothetical protein